MSKKRIAKVVFWILTGVFFILIVPMIINMAYNYGTNHTPIIITLWSVSDTLAFYGTILAAVSTVLGVYLSIKAAHKNYEEDVRVRVLPFIAVTPLEKKTMNQMLLYDDSADNKEETPVQDNATVLYEEFKLDRIYFVIASDGIKAQRTLEKSQQEIISHAGQIWKTQGAVRVLQCTKYFSLPIEIENVGNGTAVTVRIGLNRKSDIKPKYIRPMMLKQGQTIYIHIFSEEAFDTVCGEYTLEFYYEDIYGNKYVQKFPVCFGKDATDKEYLSIELVGKQIRCEGDLNRCPPLNGSEKIK